MGVRYSESQLLHRRLARNKRWTFTDYSTDPPLNFLNRRRRSHVWIFWRRWPLHWTIPALISAETWRQHCCNSCITFSPHSASKSSSPAKQPKSPLQTLLLARKHPKPTTKRKTKPPPPPLRNKPYTPQPPGLPCAQGFAPGGTQAGLGPKQ